MIYGLITNHCLQCMLRNVCDAWICMMREERCRKSVTSRYFVLSSQRYFNPPYTLVSEFATLGERTKRIFIAPLSPQFEYYVCSSILTVSAQRGRKKNFEVIIIDNV